MHKIKVIIDFMIEIEFFRPQVKFKKTISKDKEETKIDEEQDFITKHPFSGFLQAVVCLQCNLVFLANNKVEQYFTDDARGWP